MHKPLLILTALLLPACASHYKDPVARFMDRSEGHVVRWAAARQAEREMPDSPERANALKRLVWEAGHPAEFRIYAVDQLIAIDEPAARKYLAQTLHLVRNDTARQHILDQAVERKWVEFIPSLVRAYSQTTLAVKDEDRPERKAIEKLLPNKPVDQVIIDVFATDGSADISQRVAAWSLLCRNYHNQNRLIDTLKAAPEGDALVADLKAGAADLGVVPDSAETVTWLRVLRSNTSFWDRSRKLAGSLTPTQRSGLQLRHLPALIYLQDTQPAVLGQTREELLSEMTHWVDTHEHHLKGPTYDGPMDEHPQELRDWKDKLVWADLATMKMLTQLTTDRRLADAWFKLADADVKDKSTEYGGLIRRDDKGQAYVHAYEPLVRRHDLKYIPPRELVTDGYTALAHFHFHAQEHTNSRYAGPGIGDMTRIAKTQRFTGLVLTFIDKDRLNVDLYHSPEIVIDLGTIHR